MGCCYGELLRECSAVQFFDIATQHVLYKIRAPEPQAEVQIKFVPKVLNLECFK